MSEQKELELNWGELSPVELRAATELTQAFLMALKNYGLFPAEHASTINMLRGLSANLNTFINRYGTFRLGFERGRVRYEEEIVFEEYEPENNPAFVFFRDGILWLEFQEGLESHEILQFFRIVNRFKIIQEEPEGDLVTELWTADLPHVNYGVSDNLWEAEPVLEFSLLNPDAQAFLEQGRGADLLGFDLLKSVLGLVSDVPDSESGEARTGAPNDDRRDGTGESGGGDGGGAAGSEVAGRSEAGFGDGKGSGIGAGGASGGGPDGGPGGGGPGGGGNDGVGSGGIGDLLVGESGSGPGMGHPGGPGGGAGSGGTGSGLPRGGDGESTPGSGAGSGPGGAEDDGGAAGSKGAGDITVGRPDPGLPADIGAAPGEGSGGKAPVPAKPSSLRKAAEEKVGDELDFWETLKKVSPGKVSFQPPGETPSPAEVPAQSGDAVPVAASSGPSLQPASGASSSGVDGFSGPAGSGSGVGAGQSGATEGAGQATGKIDRAPLHKPRLGRKRQQTTNLLKGKDTSPVSDAATRKATAFSRPGRGGDWGDGDLDDGEQYIGVNVASIEPGHSLWNFSEEEQRTLQQMVREHEDGDNSADVIEILLILLKMEDEPQICLAIIGFLKEEFRISLVNRNFKVAHDLLVEIDMLRWQPGLVKEWALPYLERFMDDITEPEILDALAPLWSELPSLEPEALQDFAAILRLLPPKSGDALVNMSTQVEFGKGRRILIDLIASFASRDLDSLERMLSRPEEDLILRLINILRVVADRGRAEQLLFKAIKHPKEKVRQEVCDILLDRETEQFDKLFLMIYDPSPAIRGRIFSYLSRERNRQVAVLLLAHMNSDRFLNQSKDHVSNCYLALGECGDDEALPFLKKVLFGQPWNFMAGLGQSVHRRGAALALYRIRTPASLKILSGAESSSVPHIRKAWAKATGN